MNASPHLVVVDDDPAIRTGVTSFLKQKGFRVSAACNGAEMRKVLRQHRAQLILLDVMLPSEDGLSLLRELRRDTEVPVIMLTAVTSETDRVVGLELGAEDYVCKPFGLRELLARIRVVLRRSSVAIQHDGTRYVFNGWRFDVRSRTLVSPSGGYVELTTGEYELLLAFIEHPNRVLSRDELLDLARGRSSSAVDRAMDVQVMRLRRKIEPNPQSPEWIRTVRNGGYLFTPTVEREDD